MFIAYRPEEKNGMGRIVSIISKIARVDVILY
jgi:hypothetical protein